MSIRTFTKLALKRAGLDVRLVRNIERANRRTGEDKWRERWAFVNNYDIKYILDIGASDGEFARMIHKACPAARILAFEPLPDVFENLQSTLVAIPNSRAFNVALGAGNEDIEIQRSEFSPSSSILDMGDLHKRTWPKSAVTRPERVTMARLDDILDNETLEPDILVKMDVQGYETEVIRGGMSTLAKAAVVVLETSYYELYEKQPLFDDIYRMMSGMGFVFRGNLEQWANPADHRFLQADAIFENLSGKLV